MDVVTAAATLHQQLVSLHNSDTTVSILESQVTSLGHQCLMSAVEDNQSKHLRQVLHLSVTEGVHHMYQHYSSSKWAQVQNTARTIKSTLEADNNEQSETLMTSSMTSSPGGRSCSDKAIEVWSSVFCELSRHNIMY